MTWEAISTLADIFTAILMALSVFYLSIQVRNSNNKSAREAINGILDLNAYYADSQEKSNLFWKGVYEPEGLSNDEFNRWQFFGVMYLRKLEVTYLDYMDGLVTKSQWESISQIRSEKSRLSEKGIQEIFKRFYFTLHPNFVKFVQDYYSSRSIKN